MKEGGCVWCVRGGWPSRPTGFPGAAAKAAGKSGSETERGNGQTRTPGPLRVWEERDPKRPERKLEGTGMGGWGKKKACKGEGEREEGFGGERVDVQGECVTVAV